MWFTEQVGVKAPGSIAQRLALTYMAMREAKLTRHGEEDHLLVGPLFRGIVVDGDAAGGHVTALLGPWDIPETRSAMLLPQL